MNLMYEDRPNSFYDNNQPVIADRFRLDRRVKGVDAPSQAHTMVGLHRLNNLQECVERILAENVPGDLLEAGVLRGGASIFLRAVLKVHRCTDRRVIACDTFRATLDPKPTLVVDLFIGLLGTLAAIPSYAWHRRLLQTSASAYDPRVMHLRLTSGANYRALNQRSAISVSPSGASTNLPWSLE